MVRKVFLSVRIFYDFYYIFLIFVNLRIKIIYFYRRISIINRYFRDKGYDVDKMWVDIDDVIIKILILVYFILKYNYRICFFNYVKGSVCFEILGFDVFLDRKFRF